jgi:hypothetical protein
VRRRLLFEERRHPSHQSRNLLTEQLSGKNVFGNRALSETESGVVEGMVEWDRAG